MPEYKSQKRLPFCVSIFGHKAPFISHHSPVNDPWTPNKSSPGPKGSGNHSGFTNEALSSMSRPMRTKATLFGYSMILIKTEGWIYWVNVLELNISSFIWNQTFSETLVPSVHFCVFFSLFLHQIPTTWRASDSSPARRFSGADYLNLLWAFKRPGTVHSPSKFIIILRLSKAQWIWNANELVSIKKSLWSTSSPNLLLKIKGTQAGLRPCRSPLCRCRKLALNLHAHPRTHTTAAFRSYRRLLSPEISPDHFFFFFCSDGRNQVRLESQGCRHWRLIAAVDAGASVRLIPG